MKHLVLGVIGHVDHGKTALVRALTGTDTDRLAEEKRRGISIELGFAHLAIGDDTVIDLIDMPGHERFVRTLISGANGIDAVLLVVAANEGVKPQTEEHMDIVSLLGITRVLVVIAKADLATREQVRETLVQVAHLLAHRGQKPIASVVTSVSRSEGIVELRKALQMLADESHSVPAGGLAYLPVDRAFSVPGHGPVVTGTLRGASIFEHDTLELLPKRRKVRVRAVQVRGNPQTSASPGQRVAINLRDIEIAELGRGMALAVPGSLSLSEWLTLSIQALASAPPLKNGMGLRALFGTNEIEVRLRLLDRDVLDAGQEGFAQLHCAQPVAVPAGEYLILRIASPAQTVAGGKILEPLTTRHKRHVSAVLARLADLCTLPVEGILVREVERAGTAGISLRLLSRLSALTESRVIELLEAEPITLTRSGTVIGQGALDQLMARLPPLLKLSTSGLSLKQIMSELSGTGADVLEHALALFQARGAINHHGGRYTIVRRGEARARVEKESALASRIAALLQQKGLTPPTPKELLTTPSVKRAVGQLLRDGSIVRAVDRGKDRELLFHREAVEDAKRRLSPYLVEDSGLLVKEIGGLLGISRKYSVPLLNYLDEIHFTRRIGDRRVLYDLSNENI